MDNPLVSICILSFNRRDDLKRTLDLLNSYDYKPIEVLVAENASSDGTAEMLKNDYPWVRLFEIAENIGIDALDITFEKANGEFIVVLDDDSWPAEGSIKMAVERFKERSELGIVAFNILDPKTNIEWDLPNLPYKKPVDIQPWCTFVGCGFMIRTKLMQEMGGYPKDYFLYANETALAIEVLRKNYDIEFLRKAVAFHSMPLRKKGFSSNQVNLVMRNDLQTVWKYYHGWRYWDIFLGRVFTSFILSLIAGYLKEFRIALNESYGYRNKHLRTPVSKSIMRRCMPAFEGVALTSILSYRNLRRILWYFGYYKDGRLVT